MDFASLPVPMEDGHWVNERVARTVELIRQYDHRLDVVWLPPERRERNDPAYYVVEKMDDGRTLPVFSIADDEHMDERLLEQIYENDSMKQGDVLSAMDARNKARRDMRIAEHLDKEAEMRDIAAHVLKSRKSTYKANGKVYTE